MKVDVRPVAIKDALWINKAWHRRQPKLQGAMWAVRALIDGEVVGTGIVGHPQARLSADGETLEVLRVAVREGAVNACSAIYGAIAKAARGMGCAELLTFIHADESGHSLKAAGWIEVGQSDGGEWSRCGRVRQLAIDNRPKRKWCPPWSRSARRLAARLAEAAA